MSRFVYSVLLLTLFIISPFVILASDNSTASETNNEAPAVNNPDETIRCWGLNFSVKRDFTLGKQYIDKLSYYDNEEEESIKSTGFGVDWYLSDKLSLGLIGSVGIGNDTQEDTSVTQEFSQTELGAKLYLNWYPRGMDDYVYFSVGPWISFISYSETQSISSSGFDAEDEYSASRFGFGANATAYVRPSKNVNLEFFAGYNLGVFITPESTFTQTFNGETEETTGPSSFHFRDCGGMLGARFYFDSIRKEY